MGRHTLEMVTINRVKWGFGIIRRDECPLGGCNAKVTRAGGAWIKN